MKNRVYIAFAALISLYTSFSPAIAADDKKNNDFFHMNPEFYGLNRKSYGNLQVTIDPSTHEPMNPRSCDSGNIDPGIQELSRTIVGAIVSPLQGRVFRPDDPIVTQHLQHNFLISGSFFSAPVSIIDINGKSIVFWHNSDLVTLKEVINAAKEYCSNHNLKAVYEGSARKCSAPKQNIVVVNGKNTTIETYAISAFACVK